MQRKDLRGKRYLGSSNRLYVFESPIDMLSFISLNKEGWQLHSYVALCGVSEKAVLNLLEQYPHLNDVRIATDHDPPGIEALGRITDILALKGNCKVTPWLSVCKDWNADLKSACGLSVEPAIEHPHLTVCLETCQKLLEQWDQVKSNECSKERLQYLLNQAYNHIPKAPEQAAGYFERLALSMLKLVQEKYRQLGQPVTAESLLLEVYQGFRPHKYKGKVKSKEVELKKTMVGLLADNTITKTELIAQLDRYKEYAMDCVGVAVKILAEGCEQKELVQFEQMMVGQQ